VYYLTKSLAVAKLLRPQHWVKNVFVLAPLFFAPASLNSTTAIAAATGFLAFCAAASAAYAFNDIFDRESDRLHAEKKGRPLAAGIISPNAAAITAVVTAAFGLTIAVTLSPEFVAILLGYLALNVVYSMWLKHIAVLDVAIIAFFFVLRIYAGGVLIGIVPSAWIISVTGMLALFLALAKRWRSDQSQLAAGRENGRQLYPPVLLKIAIPVMLVGLVAGYIAYATDADVIARLGTDKIYYTVPFVVVGIMRYLQLVFVKKQSSDPTVLLFSDSILLIVVMCWIATIAALIYA